MSSEKEIAALLSQVKEGDERAFAHLCVLFEPLVLTAARRFCTPPVFAPSDMEDLRQEALLALFKAACSYDLKKAEGSGDGIEGGTTQEDGTQDGTTYDGGRNKRCVHEKAESPAVTFGLYAKICINNRLISAKRSKLRKLQSADPANSFKRGVGRPRKAAPVPKKSQRTLHLPTDSQLGDLLAAAREDLTPLEEQVFALYLEGTPYKEIASLLGLGQKSVDNALMRAKRKIKRLAGRG